MKKIFTIILVFCAFFGYTQTEPINPESVTTEIITINEVTFGGTDGTANQSLTTNGSGALAFQSMQPLDADLTAIAALGSTGFSVRTGTNTWVQRTLTGTANELTVTNGDGVSGNPTISIPSALTFTGKTITGGAFTSGTFNGVTLTTAGSATAFLNGAGSYTSAGISVTGTTNNGLITYDSGGGGVVESNLTWSGTSLSATSSSSLTSILTSSLSTGSSIMEAQNNVGSSMDVRINGDAFAGTLLGTSRANTSEVSSTRSIKLFTSQNQPILIGTNNALAATISTSQDWTFEEDVTADLFIGAHDGTVGATTPAAGTFTGITSPTITGGSGTTQSLTYKTTTGVGAVGARHIFQVGNNGATEAMTILNSGLVGIGTASPQSLLHISTLDGSSIYTTERVDTDVATNNEIGSMRFRGGETTIADVGIIRVSADTDWSAGASPTSMRFSTTPAASTTATERMRISKEGYVGINETSPGAELHVTGNINTTGSRITNAYFTNHTTTNAETVDSDETLKKEIEPLENAKDVILSMSAIQYKWDETKRSTADTVQHYGFSAQEIREILPSVVTSHTDSLGNEVLGVRYSEIIPFLIEAIKDLNNEIELLKAK